MALAEPPFLPPPDQLALFTGRPAMRKALFSGGTQQGGGVWFLTDLATADALALSPVGIESHPGSGTYVAPTPESIVAALPAMVPDAGGVLIASSSPPPATAGNPQPYALSMVEYAVVPAEPLRNTDCTRRDKSQVLLTNWLKYITGPAGQAALPPGMIPLTPALASAAAAALPKVGAAATTGACAGPSSPSTTTPTTSPRAAAASNASGQRSSSTGAGNLGSASSPLGAAATPPAATDPTAATGSTSPVTQAPALVALPAFGGSRGTAYGGTIVAILGIIALEFAGGIRPHRLGRQTATGTGARSGPGADLGPAPGPGSGPGLGSGPAPGPGSGPGLGSGPGPGP